MVISSCLSLGMIMKTLMNWVILISFLGLVVFFLANLFLVTYPVVRSRRLIRREYSRLLEIIEDLDTSTLDRLVEISRLIKSSTDQISEQELNSRICTLVSILSTINNPSDPMVPVPIPNVCR